MPASCPGGPHPRFTGYSCLRPSKWSCGLSEMSNPWPGTISEVNVAVDEFPQTQVLGEGHRKEQPSIGHQAVVVEGDLNAVGVLKWQHLSGAPCFWLVSCSKTIIPEAREHLLPLQDTDPTPSFGGFGIRLDARRFCVDWRPAQVCCQGGKAETGP